MPCSCQETTRILKWVLVATAPSSEGAIRAVSVPERILDIATRMLQPRLAHVSSAGIEQGAMVLQRKSAHAFSTQLDQGDLWQLAQYPVTKGGVVQIGCCECCRPVRDGQPAPCFIGDRHLLLRSCGRCRNPRSRVYSASRRCDGREQPRVLRLRSASHRACIQPYKWMLPSGRFSSCGDAWRLNTVVRVNGLPFVFS